MAVGAAVRITQSALSVGNLVFRSPSVSHICYYDFSGLKHFLFAPLGCWDQSQGFGLGSGLLLVFFSSSRASGPPRARAMLMAEAQNPSQAHEGLFLCQFANIPRAKPAMWPSPTSVGQGDLFCPLQPAHRGGIFT